MPYSCFAIESSCDETSVACVDSDRNILLNKVFSQMHSEFGGVVPELSARQHMHTLELLLNDNSSFIHQSEIIAVTKGPGLVGGLIIGIMMAKSLSSLLKKPLYTINHLEAHALTVRLTNENVEFPFLLLLLSGGHCQILIVNNISEYIKLGDTLDDSIGESFDKVSNMLGLGYPGGPAIEKAAITGDLYKFKFPQPLMNSKCCNFSFSGLKTSVRNTIKSLNDIDDKEISNITASFQYTVTEILKKKLSNAIHIAKQKYPMLKTVVMSGGVASNTFIRNELSQLTREKGIELLIPPPKLCTDNAAMIAWTAIEHRSKGYLGEQDLSFSPKSKWPLNELNINKS